MVVPDIDVHFLVHSVRQISNVLVQGNVPDHHHHCHYKRNLYDENLAVFLAKVIRVHAIQSADN